MRAQETIGNRACAVSVGNFGHKLQREEHYGERKRTFTQVHPVLGSRILEGERKSVQAREKRDGDDNYRLKPPRLFLR